MRQYSDHLFSLIKSLTPAEKRSFRLLCSRYNKEERKYILLFEAIDRQNNYDEKKILRKFRGERFAKYFPAAKQHLQKLILKSLLSYQKNLSAESQIRLFLHEAEILFNKSLFRMCADALTRAEKISVRYEKNLYRMEILGWKHRLDAAMGGTLFLHGEAEQSDASEEKLSAAHRNATQFRRLARKINIFRSRSFSLRNPDSLVQYSELMNDPLLQDVREASTYISRLNFYTLHSNYAYDTGDLEKSFSYAKDRVEWEEAHPEHIREDPYRHIVALYNLASIAVPLRRYETAEELVRKIHAVPGRLPPLPARSLNLQSRIFINAIFIEFFVLTAKAAFDDMRRLAMEMEKGLGRFKNHIPKRDELYLYYNISYLSFVTGDPGGALSWLNKFLNDPLRAAAADLSESAVIVDLMLHYDRENFDVLEYKVKSAYRFFAKKKRVYVFETTLLDFFRKNIPLITEPRQWTGAFGGLKSALEKVAEDPFEKPALESTGIISWLESKITGRSFAEILREKAKEPMD